MKIEHHLNKIKRFEATISKLGTLREDKDIKHNRLFGFLKREQALTEQSEEVAGLIQQLDQLRPSHVYGKGENGATARRAGEIFDKIKIICGGILESEI